MGLKTGISVNSVPRLRVVFSIMFLDGEVVDYITT